MRCPRPLCEGLDPDCACALAGAASALDRVPSYSSSWWGWLRCRWHHGYEWKFEDELPPYALTASLSDTDQYCPTCDLVR